MWEYMLQSHIMYVFKNVEQQTTKNSPNEFSIFHETTEKEKMFFRSTEQHSGLFPPVHARSGWLMVWKDNVIGFWKRLSPGEWHYVCLCDICDKERVSCCTTTDIWDEENNTYCDYCQRHAVISTVMDKRWVSWHPLICVKEINNLFTGKSKFYLLFTYKYFTMMLLTANYANSYTYNSFRSTPLQRHGHVSQAECK